jgi:Flp pilus assembly protein TadD
VPTDGGLHQALGLSMVRLKRLDDALIELRRGAELDPNNARYSYIYGVALHSNGRQQEAITYLKDRLTRHPDNRHISMAIVSFSREAGDAATALQYAEQACKIAPEDQALKGIVEQRRRQIRPQ